MNSNIFDHDCDNQDPCMDESLWAEMSIIGQIEYLNQAWEEKHGEIATRDYDEADYGNPAELDEAHERIYSGIPW
jgi:hypothetical protein